MALLDDIGVQAELRWAWAESNPGGPDAHEEGGFVLKVPDGSLRVERWPRGFGNAISVPDHDNCTRNGIDIIATFHTHPNTGADFLQEPGLTTFARFEMTRI